MSYDKALVAGKLRRWETYLKTYRLPDWEQIPDLGLYMEQVVLLLRQYLDYLPPELKDEEFILIFLLDRGGIFLVPLFQRRQRNVLLAGGKNQDTEKQQQDR